MFEGHIRVLLGAGSSPVRRTKKSLEIRIDFQGFSFVGVLSQMLDYQMLIDFKFAESLFGIAICGLEIAVLVQETI